MAFSRLDLYALSLKTENREIQMDVALMRLEELLEIKIPTQELAIFKKEFESFYLVPFKIIEAKMVYYLGANSPATMNS